MKKPNETDKRVKTRENKNTFRQPAAMLAPAVRLVLLCVMSAAFILMFYEFYELPGNKWEMAGIAAAASGLTFTLASLLPPVLVYGSIMLAGGAVLWLLREKIWHYLQYFWDLMMLRLDSRLIDTSRSFIHSPAKIKAGLAYETAQMNDSVIATAIILIVLAAVVFTASVRTRFHLSPPVIAATLIVAPAVASERAGFIPSFFLYAACLFGLVMSTSSFELELGFMTGHLPSARLKEHRNDLAYYRRTRFFVFGKKLRNDTERFHGFAGNCIAIAIVAGIVFYGAAALVPEGKGLKYQEVLSAFEDIGYRIADTVSGLLGTTFGASDDRGYFSEGGYNDNANSISIAPPGNSDRPVLEVTLSRNDIPVYLRGDIGVDYANNSWTGVKTVDAKYNELVPEGFYPENEYQMFRKYLAYTFSSEFPDSVLPLNMVSMRYLRNTRVIFQPLAAFELNYRENEQYDCFSDFILRTKSGYIKKYNTLSLTPNIDKYADIIFSNGSPPGNIPGYCLGGMISPPEGMTSEEYVEAIEAYGDYIDDVYLSLSPAVKQLTEDLNIPRLYIENAVNVYDAYTDYNSYLIAQEICDYFAKNFTYSLDADNGKDQLSGFLYKTHSGHCALFATAMTLALREFGIPARYVTGYVVEGEGEAVSDGYRYILTEKQLHAWCEVYFNGIGWIPFDPTAKVPGYSEVMSGEWDGMSPHDYGKATTPAETEPPKSETTTETSVPEDADPSEITTPDSSGDTTREPDELPPGGDDDSSGNGNIGGGTTPQHQPEDLFAVLLPFIVAGALIAAVIIILIMFVRSVKRAEKKVFRGFRELPPTEASELMYHFVMTLLAKKELVPGIEQFYDFAERVDGSIELKGANVFMMDVMPVFEKCEFGNAEISPVTEDERAAVYRFTGAVYSKIMGDYPSLKRFFVKISLFL